MWTKRLASRAPRRHIEPGTLVSRETYLKGEPVVLHAEITRRDCERKRAQLIFALSYAPRDAAECQEMRRRQVEELGALARMR